jgi:pimeloyl-ACP methyl ester carboxylesterase
MASRILAYMSSMLATAWKYVYNYMYVSPTSPATATKQSRTTAFAAILLTNSNESSHQRFTLPDGRNLSFATYGAAAGPVVFHLHGLGDCRFTGAFFDEPGKQLGVRIIAVDRPGIGMGSPQQHRTALDHAQDIRLLAAHLGAKTYNVMGVSGGGPYTLACAYALPAEELRSVSLVCGLGPYELTMRHSRWPVWLFYQICARLPFLLYWLRASEVKKLESKSTERFVADTRAQLDGWLYRLLGPHAKDGDLLRDESFLAVCVEAMREHFRQGVDGHMEEWRVMTAGDNGFDLREVRRDLPVHLWYGRFDTSVSWKVGEAIAEIVGSNAKLFVRDEAHLSLISGRGEEILAKLLEDA